MELVQTVIMSVLVTVVGGLVTLAMTGQFRSLHREMDARFGAIDGRFDSVDRRLERVEASMDGLRSDLTQVALAVGARPRTENG